eukprot:TRINITY_DN19284_c0_g1_i1.p1 TRINITY_DN19284_c0_g1~~TRINITY_DN19284_c0_g1_i1.p1  ORF type:complete len:154 (-),score=41.14 TRINITY_DN19284_c0_g1_i1:132-569(-)
MGDVSWSISFHPVDISSMITKVNNNKARCVEPVVKVIGKLFGNRVVIEDENEANGKRRRKYQLKTEDDKTSFGFTVSFDTLDISDLAERVRTAVGAVEGCACGHLTEDKVFTSSDIRLIRNKVRQRIRQTKVNKKNNNSGTFGKK